MKIVIAAGGSGGHVFPAVSVAREFRKNKHDIVFAGVFGQTAAKVRKDGFELFELKARGLSFASVFSFFNSIFCMAQAVVQSFSLLRRMRPQIVVGFGGYGAFPVVLAAACLKIPALIHEQNVIPGKANRLLAKIVRRIAISFSESQKYFPVKKTVLTGCPSHIEKTNEPKEKLLAKFGLSPQRPTVLVLGGSQGSRRVNQEFLGAAVLLKKDLDFQVIHVTGEHDYEGVKQSYKNSGILNSVFAFLDTIGEAYQAADAVVSRAGAVTVSEIAMFRLPAVLIPYPFAGAHQKENAKVLCDRKIAVMIEERDLSAQRLKDEIAFIFSGKKSSREATEASGGLYFPQAAFSLVQEAIRLAGAR